MTEPDHLHEPTAAAEVADLPADRPDALANQGALTPVAGEPTPHFRRAGAEALGHPGG